MQLKEVEGDRAEACGAEKRMGCSGAMYIHTQGTAAGLTTHCLFKNLGGIAGQILVAISPHCVTPIVKSRWMPTSVPGMLAMQGPSCRGLPTS